MTLPPCSPPGWRVRGAFNLYVEIRLCLPCSEEAPGCLLLSEEARPPACQAVVLAPQMPAPGPSPALVPRCSQPAPARGPLHCWSPHLAPPPGGPTPADKAPSHIIGPWEALRPMTQRWQPLPRWAGAGSLGANQPPPFTETPTRRAGGRDGAGHGWGRGGTHIPHGPSPRAH